MKRRDFLTAGTLATAGFTSILASSCNSNPSGTTTPATSGDAVAGFELDEESIGSLQEKMVAGKYSSEQITKRYLDRIEAIDKKGPLLNSVIGQNLLQSFHAPDQQTGQHRNHEIKLGLRGNFEIPG